MAEWIAAGFFNAKTPEEALRALTGNPAPVVNKGAVGDVVVVQHEGEGERQYQAYKTREGRFLLFREMLEGSVPYEMSNKKGGKKTAGPKEMSPLMGEDETEGTPRITGAQAKAMREAREAAPDVVQGLEQAGQSGMFTVLQKKKG